MDGADALRQILTPLGEGFWLALDLLIGALLWVGVRFAALRWRNLLLVGRWVVVPYFGLLFGGVSPRLMGLSGIDWQSSLALGVSLIVVTLGLLFLVQASVSGEKRKSDAGRTQQSKTDETTPANRVYGVLASGAEEFHWCFLRAACVSIAFTLWSADIASNYGAVWAAGALALPEALLAAPPGPPRLYKIVALLATTILFLFVGNFWLCWALHASIMLFAGNVRWQAEPEAS